MRDVQILVSVSVVVLGLVGSSIYFYRKRRMGRRQSP